MKVFPVSPITPISRLVFGSIILVGSRGSCPHCVTLLNTIKEMNLLNSTTIIDEKHNLYSDLRKETERLFQHKTVPIVYIKGKFIGGNKEFQGLKNKIPTLLKEKIEEDL